MRAMRFPRRSDQVRVDTGQCTPWPSGGLLVGGAVRDLLRGAEPRDLDWLVVDPEAAARETAAAVGGSCFALDEARGHWRVVGDRSFDFAPPRLREAERRPEDGAPRTPPPGSGAAGEREPRMETAEADSRRREPSLRSVEVDLRARDLTINAMALRRDGSLIDPCGGFGDLRAKRIRMTSRESLLADAVRPLRAVRFAATLGFAMEPATASLVRASASAQARDPARRPAWERVRDELIAMMASPRAAAAFARLDESGLLDVYLAELARCRGVQQGGLHHADVLRHSIEALDRLLRVFPDADAALRWATLLHDVGKPDTAERLAQRRWTFHGHDALGRTMTLAALRRLRFPSDVVARAGALVRYHMLPLPRDERAARRFVHRRRELLPDLLRLMIADREAARGPLATEAGRRAYREALGQVLAIMSERPEPAPLMTGEDVMDLLDLAPGPRVGEALRLVAEAIAVGDVTDRPGAEALLRRYAEAQGW